MSSTALAVSQQAQTVISHYAPEAIQATMSMAKALVQSKLTPRGIDTPEKAFYVIMKGRELGVPPIRALERIHIIEGKCCMAAELMLERFKQRGGRAKWTKDTKQEQAIHLVAPNGDEHTEAFTWDDATTAGLAGKDNWRKWPKSMMRARAISQGLRAMGEAEGMYDPDEMGAITTAEGEVIELPKSAVQVYTPPKGPQSAQPTTPTPAPSATPSVESAAKPTHAKATAAQAKALAAALGELGIRDRDKRLAWTGAILGREVTSWKELTSAECSDLIDAARDGLVTDIIVESLPLGGKP